MSESFILFFLFLDILFISPDGAPRTGIKERRDHLLAVHHSFPSFSAEITNEQTRKKGLRTRSNHPKHTISLCVTALPACSVVWPLESGCCG